MSEIDKLREALHGKGYKVEGDARIVETLEPGSPGRDPQLEAIVDAHNRRLTAIKALEMRVVLLAPQVPIALGSAEVRDSLRKQVREIMEGADGVVAAIDAEATKIPQAKIHEIGAAQEDVRNERQRLDAAFASFDQKLLQIVNILSTVLKSLCEMRASVTRNLL